jgi:molecular chaperone HscA
MLEDSIDHAEEDVRERMVREARVDAETILHVTRAQLAKHASRLVGGERERIETAMAALEHAAARDDAVAIRDAYDALSETSEPFARRIMDEALQETVGGRMLEEL